MKNKMDQLPTYKLYTAERLIAMGEIYYGKSPNAFQKGRYEQVRDALFAELKIVWPEVPERFSDHNALYLWLVIDRVLYDAKQEEKRILRGFAANAHTAHEQLKNWK